MTTTVALQSARTKKQWRQRLFRSNADDTLPVTIRHERIYILPTRRGMAFLGVVLIMILASMNYRLNLGYALSFIMVGLFASSLLSTYLNLVKLTFHSVKAIDAFAGEPLVFEVALSEPGIRRRHSVEVSTADSHDRLDIGKTRQVTARLRVTGAQRGIHRLGRITLSSDFPLGLWRGWGYVHPESIGYVYPKPETPPAPFQSKGKGQQAGQRQADEREFKELRTYQITDPPASIAWKAVARGGEWYSKAFEAPASDSCDIEIKWRDIDNNLSAEKRLSRMCAWIIEADRLGLPYEFQLPGVDAGQRRSFSQRQACLRKLALFDTATSLTERV